MNRFKTFQGNCKDFGVVVIFEVFIHKNPIVYHIINDNDEHYIYYEAKRYSFTRSYVIKTSLAELKEYKVNDISFNDCFKGEKFNLSIFKTHVEVKISDEEINALQWNSNITYIDTYKRVLDNLEYDKEHKGTMVVTYIGYIMIILGSLSLMIPIRWLAATVSICFLVITFVLLYIGFYKTIRRNR